MGINKRIGFQNELPEKILLSRYYVKHKYVQIILEGGSFPNTRMLRQIMHLPRMLFNDLEPEDYFGLKILKNGYDPTLYAQLAEVDPQEEKYKLISNSVSNKYL